MSNEQYSPWSSGEGFGAPQPAPKPDQTAFPPPPTLDLPTSPHITGNYQNPSVGNYQNPSVGNYQNPSAGNYQNPSVGTTGPEPIGWSEPQQFGAVQPGTNAPAPMEFGQRVPYGYGVPLLPDHPNSTLVLILGIVGLVVMPVISPVAWYLGVKANKELADHPGLYQGNGRLTAGLVLGVIGSVIALVWLAFIVLIIAVAVASLLT